MEKEGVTRRFPKISGIEVLKVLITVFIASEFDRILLRKAYEEPPQRSISKKCLFQEDLSLSLSEKSILCSASETELGQQNANLSRQPAGALADRRGKIMARPIAPPESGVTKV
jgi:hypothetical protein